MARAKNSNYSPGRSFILTWLSLAFLSLIWLGLRFGCQLLQAEEVSIFNGFWSMMAVVGTLGVFLVVGLGIGLRCLQKKIPAKPGTELAIRRQDMNLTNSSGALMVAGHLAELTKLFFAALF